MQGLRISLSSTFRAIDLSLLITKISVAGDRMTLDEKAGFGRYA